MDCHPPRILRWMVFISIPRTDQGTKSGSARSIQVLTPRVSESEQSLLTPYLSFFRHHTAHHETAMALNDTQSTGYVHPVGMSSSSSITLFGSGDHVLPAIAVPDEIACFIWMFLLHPDEDVIYDTSPSPFVCLSPIIFHASQLLSEVPTLY